MGTWITIFLLAALMVGLIVGLAALCAVALLGAGKRYHNRMVAQDTEMMLQHLPGKNCGACEAKTCRDFARQAAKEGIVPQGCPYLTEETVQELNEVLKKREADLQNRREKIRMADRQAGIER